MAPGFYYTDAITDEACSFVLRGAQGGEEQEGRAGLRALVPEPARAGRLRQGRRHPGAQVEAVLGLKLNQALNQAAQEIRAIFEKSGRKTGVGAALVK